MNAKKSKQPAFIQFEPRKETTPVLASPAMFPEDAPKILRRRKLTRRQFSRFADELAMYVAANLSADSMIMLQTLIRSGDMDAIKTFFRVIGLDKSAPQNIINLQQNNNSLQIGNGTDRTFDTLVRELDERDRHRTIDAQPVKELEA